MRYLSSLLVLVLAGGCCCPSQPLQDGYGCGPTPAYDTVRAPEAPAPETAQLAPLAPGERDLEALPGESEPQVFIDCTCVVATDKLNTKIAEMDAFVNNQKERTDCRGSPGRRRGPARPGGWPCGPPSLGKGALGESCVRSRDASSLFLLTPTQTRVLDTQLLSVQINSVVRSDLARRIVSNRLESSRCSVRSCSSAPCSPAWEFPPLA